MDDEGCKADKKVQFRDSPSREVMFTYSRRRRQHEQHQQREVMFTYKRRQGQHEQHQQREIMFTYKRRQRQHEQHQQQEVMLTYKRQRRQHEQHQEREVMFTYKRRRRQHEQQQQPPSPLAQTMARPEPQQQMQPQAHAQLEPRPKPKDKARNAPVQENKDTFWKSRDMGWKYGIMIDENRQHWQCIYCGLIRYGGGVSRLKRHLAGDLDVKMCPKVPANVAEEIRVHLQKKRERRRKQAAQNGANNIKIKSLFDDSIIEKDLLPADLMVPAETDTNILEEVTNQTILVHQDPTGPRVPLLRTRDIGWKHAVDLDGNKRRWQCKFCSLCRSGGVTTLKAHLTDNCPNVPKEISMKVSKFIKEKRATRLLFSNFAFTVADEQVSGSQIQEEGTAKRENDGQPSRKITHKCAFNETLEPSWKRGFSTRKHIVIVDATARHWRCRYCGMDGYGKKFRLHYHLAGAFGHPKCPSVPKEVFAKARHYVKETKSVKRVKPGQQNPSGLHIVGQSSEELLAVSPSCENIRKLPHGPSHREVLKDATEKIRNQMISKDEQRARMSVSFDGNGNSSSRSSQSDQVQFTTTIKKGCPVLIAPTYTGSDHFGSFDHASSKLGSCNTLANCSPESVNTLMYHEQEREKAGVSPFVFHLQQMEEANVSPLMLDKQLREEYGASPLVFHEKNREEVASPSEPGCFHDQRMQWLLQNKPIMEERPQENQLFSNTDKSEKQRSNYWTNCWRNILDGLMRSPYVQEGAGISTCIRDALLYGCAQLGTVPDAVELADRNTAKCQNVLVDILRSEDFVLLCNVLCRTLHQDGERTRYFDFSVIDSRMKNGNYGHEPELFMHDLKLVWEDLKMAGQNIVELANSLSSLTEACCGNLLGREKESGDNELKGAVMISSGPINLVESNALLISTSQNVKHVKQSDRVDLSERVDLSQSNPVDVSDVQDSTCERLAVRSSPKCEDTPNDNSRAIVHYSVDSLKDSELPEIDMVGTCKICGNPEEEDKRFLMCGYAHCLYKYYHICCLKSKQMASNVQGDKTFWYCPSCLCRVCLSDKDGHLTILCDGCDEAYHLYCMTPRRSSIPKGQWYCSSCSTKRAQGGMRQYERRMRKLHRKVDTKLQNRKFDGIDLLLSAADRLSADEQLVSCTN